LHLCGLVDFVQQLPLEQNDKMHAILPLPVTSWADVWLLAELLAAYCGISRLPSGGCSCTVRKTFADDP